MPSGQSPGNAEDSERPDVTRRERLIEWVRGATFKAVDPGDTRPSKATPQPKTVEELEAATKSADDKERVVGLIAAPFAAIITFIVIGALISNDPADRLADGAINTRHVPVSTYHEVLIVLLVLAVGMMAMAWLRKRLFLAICLAMFGLAVFNLHYWGFGVPYVLAGAWFLMRAYRLSRDLKLATGGVSPRQGTEPKANGSTSRPRRNKRYTPPA